MGIEVLNCGGCKRSPSVAEGIVCDGSLWRLGNVGLRTEADTMKGESISSIKERANPQTMLLLGAECMMILAEDVARSTGGLQPEY